MSEPRTAKRSMGFTKFTATSYETEDGDRRVRLDKVTRMHRFGGGYSDYTNRPVFRGSEAKARMLYEVLGEVLDDE